jgi:hypothetical protein
VERREDWYEAGDKTDEMETCLDFMRDYVCWVNDKVSGESYDRPGCFQTVTGVCVLEKENEGRAALEISRFRRDHNQTY